MPRRTFDPPHTRAGLEYRPGRLESAAIVAERARTRLYYACRAAHVTTAAEDQPQPPEHCQAQSA
jgi:hypothetical protein